jgi:hypothetical protein
VFWLDFPFEEVYDQNAHSGLRLTQIALTHVPNLQGDLLQVRLGHRAVTQPRGHALRPIKEISVV